MLERQVRFEIAMPSREDPDICETPTGRERSATQVESAVEQAVRQKWRALALVVKAKLEAVESGITSFEEEFLAHILLPDGSTVGGTMIPQIAVAYETGRMPALLPAPPKTRRLRS